MFIVSCIKLSLNVLLQMYTPRRSSRVRHRRNSISSSAARARCLPECSFLSPCVFCCVEGGSFCNMSDLKTRSRKKVITQYIQRRSFIWDVLIVALYFMCKVRWWRGKCILFSLYPSKTLYPSKVMSLFSGTQSMSSYFCIWIKCVYTKEKYYSMRAYCPLYVKCNLWPYCLVQIHPPVVLD